MTSKNIITSNIYKVILKNIIRNKNTDQIKASMMNNVCLLFVFFTLQPFGCIFHSPVAGFNLLIRGFLITHNDAPQSVGLLWTSDQSVAETST